MHDADILEVSWSSTNKTLKLHIDDIYSNLLGFPEYPGKTPGHIIFNGVNYLRMNFESDEILRIYDFLISEDIPPITTILFWPQGKIDVCFSSVHYPEIKLK